RSPSSLATGVRADPGRAKWQAARGRPPVQVTLCQRPDHLEVVTQRENTKRRGPTRRPAKAREETTDQRFAVALFAAIDRPVVAQKSLSLDELVDMLSRFEVLEDK